MTSILREELRLTVDIFVSNVDVMQKEMRQCVDTEIGRLVARLQKLEKSKPRSTMVPDFRANIDEWIVFQNTREEG
jgi:hypothetical protein